MNPRQHLCQPLSLLLCINVLTVKLWFNGSQPLYLIAFIKGKVLVILFFFFYKSSTLFFLSRKMLTSAPGTLVKKTNMVNFLEICVVNL
jgi:hypothetical protein